MPAGRSGSTVSANNVLSVLAGGSLRCASCAASTSPLSASATTHDSAETSGRRGAFVSGRTWVPDRYSSRGCGAEACGPPGASGSEPVDATAAAGASTSRPAVHSAQADATAREGNPMVIPQN